MKYFSDSILAFTLRIGKQKKRVRFIPMTGGGSYYVTHDRKEAKALEAMPCFGSRFIQIEAEPAPVKAAKVDLEKVAGVKTYQEAIDYLEKRFGSDRSLLNSPSQILEEAEKKQVVFTDMK